MESAARALAFPFDSYNTLRKEQSSEALAARLEGFAARIRGSIGRVQLPGPSADRVPLHRPKQSKPPVSWIFVRSAPYTMADPDPSSIVHPLASYPGIISTQAFGDRVRGEISVGVNGGLIDGAGFGGGSAPFQIPMPERWLLGDVISSSAALMEVAGIPEETKHHSHAHLSAEVGFGLNPAVLRNIVIPDPLNECLIYHPGLSTAPVSGFIGIVASLEVAITLSHGASILGSKATVQPILDLGINADLRGLTPDNSNYQYLFRDWAYEADPTGSIGISVTIPFNYTADQLTVEARVRLYGLRGGVEDPAAGWVNAAFQNVDQNMPQTGIMPSLPCPFAVRQMSAFAW
jgi:hypothetical protein